MKVMSLSTYNYHQSTKKASKEPGLCLPLYQFSFMNSLISYVSSNKTQNTIKLVILYNPHTHLQRKKKHINRLFINTFITYNWVRLYKLNLYFKIISINIIKS